MLLQLILIVDLSKVFNNFLLRNFSWAPSNLDTWSIDNRTSPFRICGEGKSLRIEYRIPGGDINQYLAYSGLLASVRIEIYYL